MLGAHGIDVQHELMAVGENFRDHLNARIQFELAGDGGGPFWLELCDGAIRGDSGRLDAPDLVLSTDLETWRKLNAGELKAPTAVMKGRLRFQGSMYLALKIHFILG